MQPFQSLRWRWRSLPATTALKQDASAYDYADLIEPHQ